MPFTTHKSVRLASSHHLVLPWHPVQHFLGRQLATLHEQVSEVSEELAAQGNRGSELQLQLLHQLPGPAGQVLRQAQQEAAAKAMALKSARASAKLPWVSGHWIKA